MSSNVLGRKILIVGEPGSIHTGRFVSLLQEIGYDARIFQCEYRMGQDEHLQNTKVYVAFPYIEPINGNVIIGHFYLLNFLIRTLCRNPIFQKYLSIAINRYFYDRKITRPKHLAKLIKRWKPDIVFSLKMQNDGYTVSTAKDLLCDAFKAKWIHFNWGTDIELFGKHADFKKLHSPKIKKLLSQCDFHIADCERDAKQAIKYGFNGKSLGSCIAQGGISISLAKQITKKAAADNDRNNIIIKGRQDEYVGKALNVLQAIHRNAHLLSDYKIKIFMTTPDVASVSSFLCQIDSLDIEIIPRIPYQELLKLYARSRIAISASCVDGTPGFLLESMAMGALPIHSDLDSIREWVNDGENGLLFPVNDIDVLASAIEKALTDDVLVERAKRLNWSIIKERADRQKIANRLKYLIENEVIYRS